MEEYQNRQTKMLMRKGVNSSEYFVPPTPETYSLVGTDSDQMLTHVFEHIRDASSTESYRAIQDSETNVAQEQKRVIKTLARKGWTKNMIIYEVQRIYGNDVLIKPEGLDDERGFVMRYGGLGMLMMSGLALAFLARRFRNVKSGVIKTSNNDIRNKLNIKK